MTDRDASEVIDTLQLPPGGPEEAMLQLWPAIAPALALGALRYQGTDRATFWRTFLTLSAGTIGADLGSHEHARQLLAGAAEISRRAEAELPGFGIAHH